MERETLYCVDNQHNLRLHEFDLTSIKGPVHFIGIGGIGMSAIARILLARGVAVSGSDKADGEILQALRELGATIFVGHGPSNVTNAGIVVISTAISEGNPELVHARQMRLPILHRSELLRLLSKSSRLVAVSGTHGKTTTTGMIAQVLIDSGRDPSVVIGGIFDRIGSNARAGNGQLFVAEADESDGTHSGLRSDIAVVTNIEADHLENYPGGLEQIKDVMISFANNSNSAAIVCQDDPGCRSIIPKIAVHKVTYGRIAAEQMPTFGYESLDGNSVRVYHNGKPIGEVTLSVPGEHNKLNALAAIAVGLELGVAFPACASALSRFAGVDRRFQIVGECKGITVVDDYAHHPTELIATLRAAKQYLQNQRSASSAQPSRVVALFQPHQPGRLRDLWDDFLKAFSDADLALITDIYVARGVQIEGVTTERLVSSMPHPNVHHLPGTADQLAALTIPYLRTGDLLLTIGAGNITQVGPQILKLLQTTAPANHG